MEEPQLSPGDEFYLRAFSELSTCRAIAFEGSGPIPWKDIVQFGLFSELDEDLLKAFVKIIRHMDDGYLKWQRDNRPKG